MEAVPANLYEKVMIPRVTPEEERSEEMSGYSGLRFAQYRVCIQQSVIYRGAGIRDYGYVP
jgi:hypothetical protein